MKKIYFISICCSLMLGACSLNQGKQEDAFQQERDSLQQIINERDTELNDIVSMLNEVQQSIQRITEAEGRITITDATREGAGTREAIRENMQFIQESMKQNRDMIAQLKEKLKKSSFNNGKLQQTISQLQAQMDQQTQRVQELEAELVEKNILIDGLNEDIDALAEENKANTEKLAAQEKELNQAWFVFGTKTELKEQKILQKGDVLRNKDFNKDYFTQIDIRYDKDIKFYSKSAELLTTHPKGSYSLVRDKEGQYELHITKPEQFWSVSRYLVVQVK